MMLRTDPNGIDYPTPPVNYSQQFAAASPYGNPVVYATEAGPAVFYTTAPIPFMQSAGAPMQWIPAQHYAGNGYSTDRFTSSPSTAASGARSSPLSNAASSPAEVPQRRFLSEQAHQWYPTADRCVVQHQGVYQPSAEYCYYPANSAFFPQTAGFVSVPSQQFAPSPAADHKPESQETMTPSTIGAERSASASSSSSTTRDAPAFGAREKEPEQCIQPPRNHFQSYADAMSACGLRDVMPIIMPVAQIPPAAMRMDGSYMGDVKVRTEDMQPGSVYPHANYIHPTAAAAAVKSYGVVDTRLAEAKPSSNKKKRKDPSAPKNPLSAYLFFVTEQRSQLAQQTHSGNKPEEGSAPGSSPSFSEVAKELGQRWKSMTEEQRRPYTEMAKKDKERYEAEKLAFGRKKVFIS
eukprot:TRINITY_DN1011_c0_g1_i1.p2 TRINITY_DN1011_c0_g1~~TRINITY_DN1011_c0_g1_i1.p2  ORF type:complete len:407 (-),score=82.37 TRINITY_DN1011_c0_g1_i1:1702-2922(-)